MRLTRAISGLSSGFQRSGPSLPHPPNVDTCNVLASAPECVASRLPPVICQRSFDTSFREHLFFALWVPLPTICCQQQRFQRTCCRLANIDTPVHGVEGLCSQGTWTSKADTAPSMLRDSGLPASAALRTSG